MPNIRSAKKKVRKDIKRTKHNVFYRDAIKKAITIITKLKGGEGSGEKIKKTVSLIDKAAKKKVIHKNKASRLKSRVMKLSVAKK
ncbi:30S ribosomal protein S20 [Candidatus Roizmanbacteria bacterium RIFOXYB2_FULL_38_10]|uniref:Small ribosomal subunit protein bS20 n=1 Tax=Candidatus Roizmanbacteria bacterium RIFOXYD1_FULL_38_12 TaxID=1802093 RepID=A0A1F7KZW7_9BACT|nr:MAG: 30S ribosomal protein S20 [Candidatus Roizmanbacteria bacterium RIFOXYA2_FULL_38_14]OGK63424.1 MAG: 30S ribosomal protein S20 [Candidatus Roizmanbacteria bacterium RIFOXYA1_FULL_37_12]OGK65270.1 MAG: 30S ribosomal protein S20 [Candidatus Roizmanbacteria bacterium RIFOXYB1_FULL_40_23]OGK68823.1 MAG: 30S ribosomal protein S20 [Candidatus Roizmanbacteria bacterium RIFOXYB2_FULL_38_10]OGK69675.1 MAG: 30S ribosomal protein S20 [Candidatus Roizmanbacteria bacterium RIFOXYC1_FULL_38_14]OGK728